MSCFASLQSRPSLVTKSRVDESSPFNEVNLYSRTTIHSNKALIMTTRAKRNLRCCIFDVAALLLSGSDAFLYSSVVTRRQGSFVAKLNVLSDVEAEFVESMIEGEKYSMVALPDSMLSTTLFVGNLCEFVQDGELSTLFQSVSVLQSLPACVARKANTQSLEYGFVAFPTVEETEVSLKNANFSRHFDMHPSD